MKIKQNNELIDPNGFVYELEIIYWHLDPLEPTQGSIKVKTKYLLSEEEMLEEIVRNGKISEEKKNRIKIITYHQKNLNIK